MKRSIAARVAAAAVATIALAGCSYTNPVTTTLNYAASDGYQYEVGDVSARSVLVIAAGEGEPATLIGTLVNRSTEDVTVTVSFDGVTETAVAVPAFGSVRMGPFDGEVEVSGTATAIPGKHAHVAMVSDVDGLVTTQVLILDGTLSEYQSVVNAIG